ncbi:MAG: bifunctional glutamate N-acetyltransferase/amino-acid acetyltransferase ArgJ [Chitinispirillia bacterium]|nr:bifunctional glutamate N-acetyltransferase/amino-acid acetyltransferase ArgJ [Chitinispirillia bacterium]MCL2240927.1 bifunctional glutamate N-acetyltransferase/amino-acid acetyltransferase ArgJ [Chitinispirillia bacterium]MCL2242105.1 bifunctional glutamate N-acetyltransferase/amino-acid acetyltransferase ArgJ [Chitinispirillia bacterium]
MQTKKIAPKTARPAKKMPKTAIFVEPAKGGVTAAAGFFAAVVKAGIKASKKTDLAAVLSDRPAAAAGTFTKNAIRASSVDWCEALLPSAKIRAFLCNAGCANACTGDQGVRDTAGMAALAGIELGVPQKSVLVASTGVIGKFLPMEKIANAMPKLAAALAATAAAGTAFAQAIMTTDLARKESAVKVTVGKGTFFIGGTTKGSGMIHPNMATMLCFITSDAAIDSTLLNTVVKRVVNKTFNNLTVDGDTSTNDMVLVMANGASGVSVKGRGEALIAFEEGLFTVCNDLCKKIAADGEGATKRVEVNVKGAKTEADAQLAAKAVATSNLTKCALFGNDPNWGRIACAVGYSGAKFSKQKMSIELCGIEVFKNLQPVAFDQKKAHALLKKKVVGIDIDLGLGDKMATAHTCDFSYDYVKINAEYHT